MTKTGWAVAIIVVLAIIGIGTAAYFGMKQNTRASAESEQTENSLPTDGDTDDAMPDPGMDASVSVDATVGTSSVVTVTYTDAGFAPKLLNVAVGTTVRFVNTSTHGMWVGSDDHPTHTKYDGTSTKDHCVDGKNTTGTFDECVAAAPGTVYSFTFAKAGSFSYHNHVKSSDGGTVVVK